MDDLHDLLALVALSRALRRRRQARQALVDAGPPTEARAARDVALAAELRRSVASPGPGASHAALTARLRRSITRHHAPLAPEVEPGPATCAHGNMGPASDDAPTSFDPRRWAA